MTEAPKSSALAAAETPARRRRAPLSALKQKLAAPQREGFVRRWVDNDPSRMRQMAEMGYSPVQDTGLPSDSIGTPTARFGGKRANGEPQHLVLMETPAEDYALGVREKEEQLAPFETALKAGKDTTGQLENTYEPANRSSLR